MDHIQFKVCSGAGCRAWGSEELAEELQSIIGCQETPGIELELVPCMNSCGGGVSIHTSGCEKNVFKFRSVDKALEHLGERNLIPHTAV